MKQRLQQNPQQRRNKIKVAPLVNKFTETNPILYSLIVTGNVAVVIMEKNIFLY